MGIAYEELKRVNPEELLQYFKDLGEHNRLPIDKVAVGEYPEDNVVRIDVVVMGKGYHFYLPVDWNKEIGAFYYYTESQTARELVENLITERYELFYEEVYKPWVYNDTGYRINAQFEKEIIEKINLL